MADPAALAAAMLAEYQAGRRRAPKAQCLDTGRMMADRLRVLTHAGVGAAGCPPDQRAAW